jgi:hypothetical protein
MSDKSKVLEVRVRVAIFLNCIAIAGAWFLLYQRTTLHRWDNALIPTLCLTSFLLFIVLKRLEKHQEQNV